MSAAPTTFTSGMRSSQFSGWETPPWLFEPGFPFSKLITNLVKSCKAPDRRGFGCDRGGAEVARRWVRRKNSPFSSRSTALCGSISKARG